MAPPPGLFLTHARLRNILPFHEEAVLDLEPGMTLIYGVIGSERTSLFLALLQALEGRPREGHPDMFPKDSQSAAVLTLSDGTCILRTGREFRFLSDAALSCGAGVPHGQSVLIPPTPAGPRPELRALLVDFSGLPRSGPLSPTQLMQKALGEKPEGLPIAFLQDIFPPKGDPMDFMTAGMQANWQGWQMVASAGDISMVGMYCLISGPSCCYKVFRNHLIRETCPHCR